MGERPTLAIGKDGATHLAYLTKVRLGSPRAQGEDWGNAETHSASQPSWPPWRHPTTAALTYLGAAEHGPDALWLCRAPRRNRLMPSLGAT